MALDHHIGTRLRALRTERSLSASKVAVSLGIAEQDYRDFELGRQPIPARRLFQLCLILEVPVTTFLDGFELASREGRPQSRSASGTTTRRDKD